MSANKFKLKGIRLGPFPKGKKLKLKICNFVDSKFKLNKKFLVESKKANSDGLVYYEQTFSPELIIHSDIKITLKKDINFFAWINMWYASLELIKKFYDKEEENIIRLSCRTAGREEKEDRDRDRENGVDMRGSRINNKTSMFTYNTNEDDINKPVVASLFEIIYKLKHNSDLNELINKINNNLNLNMAHKFDKENMEIQLSSNEFDKFQEKKEYNNLEMTIFFSLSDK